MKITLTLDADVYQAVAALARGSGVPIGKALSQVARRGLRSAGLKKRKEKLPTFAVAIDSPIIPGNLVQKTWEEEGLS